MNTLYVSQENLQLQLFTICICRSTKGDNSNDAGQKKQTHSHENNISINFYLNQTVRCRSNLQGKWIDIQLYRAAIVVRSLK